MHFKWEVYVDFKFVTGCKYLYVLLDRRSICFDRFIDFVIDISNKVKRMHIEIIILF